MPLITQLASLGLSSRWSQGRDGGQASSASGARAGDVPCPLCSCRAGSGEGTGDQFSQWGRRAGSTVLTAAAELPGGRQRPQGSPGSQAAPRETGRCVHGCTCACVGVRCAHRHDKHAYTCSCVGRRSPFPTRLVGLPLPLAVLWGRHLCPDAAGQELPAGASGPPERSPAWPPREPRGCSCTPPSGDVAESALQ